MEKVCILGGIRSYIGLKNGIYRHIPAEELGAAVLKELLERYPSARQADFLICGNGVGAGGNITRLMALTAGMKDEIPCVTVDLQCSSGLEAVSLAAAKIESGEADICIAGGFESSSTQPVRGWNSNHPDYSEEHPYYTTAQFIPGVHRQNIMLESGEFTAESNHITREEMDRWVLESHRRAVKAQKNHTLENVVVSVFGSTKDEGIRLRMSQRLLDHLPALVPGKGLLHTAHSSMVNDGAAFVIVCSENCLQKMGQKAEFFFRHSVSTGTHPMRSPETAVMAIRKLMEKYQLHSEEVNRFECNEAFAVIDALFEREFPDKTECYNTYGGALAYGHPYGASGTVILLHLMTAMKEHQEHYGICSVAAAGGIGTATLIERK